MPNGREDDTQGRTTRLQAAWRNVIILLVVGGFGFLAWISILYFMNDTVIVDLGYRHFATIFGLPAAAAGSLLIVLVTRAISGAMSVEFLGLKFQGAASEAIMWVVCFLAMAYAVGSTWNLEYSRDGPLIQHHMNMP
jgi:hypothetical protein